MEKWENNHRKLRIFKNRTTSSLIDKKENDGYENQVIDNSSVELGLKLRIGIDDDGPQLDPKDPGLCMC